LSCDAEKWFFTMELIHGTDLLDHLRADGSDLGRPQRALGQVCRGVMALHQAGKLHRDLKPSNVLVTPEGRVVLLDFGLVRDLDGATITSTAGTPAYMSPEQCRGEVLTEASDWYALGVMLYEALTGRRPFDGPQLQILHDSSEPTRPRPRASRRPCLRSSMRCVGRSCSAIRSSVLPAPRF
jgi:serine/threonine protein kinase